MTDIEYVSCPFCFHTQPLGSRKGHYPPGDYEDEPSKTRVIQIRRAMPGPGKGHKTRGQSFGFPVIGGLSMEEAAKDPTYAEVTQAIKARILQVVRSYIEAGIISAEELDNLYAVKPSLPAEGKALVRP
jgi:hypothetical protein